MKSDAKKYLKSEIVNNLEQRKLSFGVKLLVKQIIFKCKDLKKPKNIHLEHPFNSDNYDEATQAEFHKIILESFVKVIPLQRRVGINTIIIEPNNDKVLVKCPFCEERINIWGLVRGNISASNFIRHLKNVHKDIVGLEIEQENIECPQEQQENICIANENDFGSTQINASVLNSSENNINQPERRKRRRLDPEQPEQARSTRSMVRNIFSYLNQFSFILLFMQRNKN